MWLTLAKQLEELGCQLICIKDMAGLPKPYGAKKLIKGLKETVSIPIAMQCHATTGLITATYKLSLLHITEPTRQAKNPQPVFGWKKKIYQ